MAGVQSWAMNGRLALWASRAALVGVYAFYLSLLRPFKAENVNQERTRFMPATPAMPHSESATWDAVVVGASFGGLSFASGAAARGLRVLVLERDPEVGGVVRTTGVLFSDVLDVIDVPKRYLMNSVRRISLLAADQRRIEIGANTWRFYMGDVTGMLQWMADAARDHGVTVRTGVLFQDATRDADGTMRISVTSADGAATQETIHAKILIGADGAHSQVARRT